MDQGLALFQVGLGHGRQEQLAELGIVEMGLVRYGKRRVGVNRAGQERRADAAAGTQRPVVAQRSLVCGQVDLLDLERDTNALGLFGQHQR
ncbi:hypothetical protein D3C86_1659750 [compost metagenome]